MPEGIPSSGMIILVGLCLAVMTLFALGAGTPGGSS